MRGNMTDSKLIQLYLSGDDTAFETLYQRYERKLFSYIFRMLRNRDDAEEVFQKTWIKMIEKIGAYSEQGKFSSWLFNIAHNCTIDLIRKNKKINCNSSLDELEYKLGDVNGNPETAVLIKEKKQRLAMAVQNLPDEQKEVVLMRIYGELAFKEIAEVLDTSVNTVLGRMHYAVKRIKKEFGGILNEV